MAHEAEQGHTASSKRLAAMRRRELLTHCKTIMPWLQPAAEWVRRNRHRFPANNDRSADAHRHL
jgi:hypothetical protein